MTAVNGSERTASGMTRVIVAVAGLEEPGGTALRIGYVAASVVVTT
jgi:hypothetical protein